MSHDPINVLFFVVALLAFSLLVPRLLGGANDKMKSSLEAVQQRSVVWHQETAEFQQQLLAELKRHNALMEQQSQLLTRLLERLGQ